MDANELERGYEEMSRDTEREAKALEWCQALNDDAFCDTEN